MQASEIRSGIYAIRNLKNSKIYVGSAINIAHRWAVHRYGFKNKIHHSRFLQRAWDKHGSEAFSFDILEHVEDVSILIEREQYWIDNFSSANPKLGYNINPLAASSLGRKLSEERKALLKGRGLGRKHSAETRRRISASNIGKKMPAEHKEKLRSINKGKKHSKEHRAKITAAKQGWKPSLEHRAALTRSRLGVKCSPETIERYRQAQLGKKLSPEHKEKLSLALRLRVYTEKTRKNMSAAAKASWAKRKLIRAEKQHDIQQLSLPYLDR